MTITITALQQAGQIMVNILATAMRASRCSVNHLMRTSPDVLTFCRDMSIDVPIMVDLIATQNRRQQLLDNNLIWYNCKRYNYHY